MREGTRKSRAPSGVLFMRIGVSISMKPLSQRYFRASAATGVPENDVALQNRPAQVKVAVFEPQLLGFRGVGIVDMERRRIGLVKKTEGGRHDLDFAGRHFRVGHGAGPLFDNRPFTRDHELVPQSSRRVPASAASAPGLNTTWVTPVPVAEVNKDDAAVVAPVVHPAVQHDLGFFVFCASIRRRYASGASRRRWSWEMPFKVYPVTLSISALKQHLPYRPVLTTRTLSKLLVNFFRIIQLYLVFPLCGNPLQIFCLFLIIHKNAYPRKNRLLPWS